MFYSHLTSRQTIEEFYGLYYSSNEYRAYLAGVQDAVNEAYKYAGSQTIPNLSAYYYQRFIETVMQSTKNSSVSGNTYHIKELPQNDLKGLIMSGSSYNVMFSAFC